MEFSAHKAPTLNDEMNESQIDLELSLAKIHGNEAQVCDIELYDQIDWENLWQASGNLALLEHPSEMLDSDTHQVMIFRGMLFALQTIQIAGRGRHDLLSVSRSAAGTISAHSEQAVDAAWSYLAQNTSISTHVSNYVTLINPDGLEFGTAEAAYAVVCMAADTES